MFQNIFSPARRCNKFAVLDQLNKAKADHDALVVKTSEAAKKCAEQQRQREERKRETAEFCKEVQKVLEEAVFFYESGKNPKSSRKTAPLDMIVKVGTDSASLCEPKQQTTGSTAFLCVRYAGDTGEFSKQTKRAVLFALKTLESSIYKAADIVVVMFYCESKIDLRLEHRFN